MKDSFTGSNLRPTSAHHCDLLRFSSDNLRKYRNSATAERLWQARVPFEAAMLAVLEGAAQPQEVITQLAHSYKVYEQTVTIPRSLTQAVTSLVQTHLSSYPNDADALFVLANLPGNGRHPEWIIQQLDRCIQLTPTEAAFYAARGKQKLALHDWNGAVHDFQSSVDLDPLDYEYLYWMGLALARLAQNNSHAVATAKRALRSFIAAAPKDAEHVPDAYYELAALSHSAGETTEMKELYEKGRMAEQKRLRLFRTVQSEVRDMLATELAVLDADSLRSRRKGNSDRLRDATFHALTTALLIIG